MAIDQDSVSKDDVKALDEMAVMSQMQALQMLRVGQLSRVRLLALLGRLRAFRVIVASVANILAACAPVLEPEDAKQEEDAPPPPEDMRLPAANSVRSCGASPMKFVWRRAAVDLAQDGLDLVGTKGLASVGKSFLWEKQ